MHARRIGEDGRGARVAVLTLYFAPEYSGAAIQLESVMERLRALGVTFTVLTSGVGPGEAAPGDGLRVRRFRTPRAGVGRQLVFGLRAALWLLRCRRWDLLHTIDFSYETLAPWAVARLLGRPVLVKTTLLESEARASLGAWLFRRVRGFGYRAVQCVVALSDALEARLREVYGVRGRILRIPNGVDTDRFRPPEEGERARRRAELGLPDGAFVPVHCGMRIERKNALGLVESVGRMEHRPVHLVLIGPPGGDPAYEERLREAIGRLPEGVQVTVAGSLPAEEVAATLRAADAYVLPSRGEGMPNSILEAMATGLPCVATDIPGSRDVLAEAGGRLVPLDEPSALAQALDRLAADAAERERLGREALRTARERYALARVASDYGRAYAALLGATGTDPG